MDDRIHMYCKDMLNQAISSPTAMNQCVIHLSKEFMKLVDAMDEDEEYSEDFDELYQVYIMYCSNYIIRIISETDPIDTCWIRPCCDAYVQRI